MDRVEQVQTWLNENQVEAAVFRLAENILLLSGYWPALGIAMVVVTANGQAMLVAPDTDGPDLQSNQLTDVRLYPTSSIGHVSQRHGELSAGLSGCFRKYGEW